MGVLLVLSVLVGAGTGQQATSYQNFRASHGQGHPTYRADGSWSQSFGGGHRSFGGGFRRLSPFIGGHQAFGPSPAHFGVFNPRPLSITAPQLFSDPVGPSAFPTPPTYDSPPGNNFITSVPSPAFVDTPSPTYSPGLPVQGGSLPTYGDDRLPSYSDSPDKNFDSDRPAHNSGTGPTSLPFIEGPTSAPLENRGVSSEIGSEGHPPQVSYQIASSNTLGLDGNPDGRSVSFQAHHSGSYQSEGNYGSLAGQGGSYQSPGPAHGVVPTQSSGDYGGGLSDYPSPGRDYASSEYNDRAPSTDYGPSHTSDYTQGNNGPSQSYGSNSGNPISGYQSPERGGAVSDYPPKASGHSSDYNSNSGGPPSRVPTFSYSSGPGPTPLIPQTNSPSPGTDYSGTAKPLFRPEGRKPTHSLVNKGTSFDPDSKNYRGEDRRPFYDDTSNKPLSKGITHVYSKPLHSPLKNNGPQAFTHPNKPVSSGRSSGLSPGLQSGFKPSQPLRGGTHTPISQNGPAQQPGANRGKPNYSTEEGGASFESDFKSSELGEQSFESDIPGFTSEETYFNSQEGYGSFESGGKGGFASDEGKGSYEVDAKRNFHTDGKRFADRDSSYESGERSPNEERTNPPRSGGPGSDFRSDGQSRASVANENKSIMTQKSFSESGDKTTYRRTPEKARDSTQVAYTGDPTVSRPLPGTGRPTYPMYPEKRPSSAIEKYVPLNSDNSPRRTPYSVETFPATVTRIYKRRPSGERVLLEAQRKPGHRAEHNDVVTSQNNLSD